MKKYFVFAAAALTALASCSKVEVDQTAQNGPEIGFQVANYMTATKAGETAFSTAETFGTFAIYTNGDLSAHEGQAVFMDNVEIKYNAGSPSTWKAAQTYYWPKTGKLSFISYAPYAAGTNATFTSVADQANEGQTINTFGITSYSVIPAISDQVRAKTSYDANDLMYSTLQQNLTSNGAGTYKFDGVTSGVPTLFHHMLSKINVNVKVKELTDSKYSYGVVVRKVQLVDVANKGSYTNTDVLNGGKGIWTITDDKISPVLYERTTGTTPALATFAKDTDFSGITTTPSTLVSDYYVMPQAFASDNTAKLVVEYDLYTLLNGKVVSKEEITSTNTTLTAEQITKYTKMSLNGIGMADDNKKDSENNPIKYGAKWVENTVMTYNVIINPVGAEVLFDPAVSGWDAATGSQAITLD